MNNNNINKVLEYKNNYALKQSERISNEIKEAVKYNLYEDNLILI